MATWTCGCAQVRFELPCIFSWPTHTLSFDRSQSQVKLYSNDGLLGNLKSFSDEILESNSLYSYLFYDSEPKMASEKIAPYEKYRTRIALPYGLCFGAARWQLAFLKSETLAVVPDGDMRRVL